MKTFTKISRLSISLLTFIILSTACRAGQSDSGNNTDGSQTQEAVAVQTTDVPTERATATAEPADTAVPTSPPPTANATATPTSTPSATPVPTQTNTPLPTDTPLPTNTPLPTDTPTPTATATIPPPPQPEWLSFLNRFRAMANLPPVLDYEPYNLGSEIHSRYMVANDAAIAHSEDPTNPFYDPAGDLAAKNGNLFATSQTEANYIWSMNFWASAPFHLVDMLRPNLNNVGYGDYIEAGGDVAMASVLDIGSDPGRVSEINYPVLFPGSGSRTWIVRHSLYEWPDPLASCPGFSRPAGAPIVLFLGNGSRIPHIENFRLSMGETPLDACIFDQTTYNNPDSWAEKTGRQILSHNNAVVIMPRHPLAADETYTVQVTANGETTTWQFETIKRPE
jgi:hypothetical protein